MKLHFDSKQQYQIEAIDSVTKLFEGQPLSKGEFELSGNGTLDLTELGFGNRISITETDLLKNLQQVQEGNELLPSEQIKIFNTISPCAF